MVLKLLGVWYRSFHGYCPYAIEYAANFEIACSVSMRELREKEGEINVVIFIQLVPMCD